jgi:hypothetical protein
MVAAGARASASGTATRLAQSTVRDAESARQSQVVTLGNDSAAVATKYRAEILEHVGHEAIAGCPPARSLLLPDADRS